MAQPEVTIEQGTLRGSTAKDLNGNNFYKFQGIPYAKPPLDNLRFKSPVPPEKWMGIFNATKEGDSCYARDPLKNSEIYGSENCLFLNVYTKNLSTNPEDLRPVLFWIHGGAFTLGSVSEEYYGANFLITEEIVLVTINYRLGLLEIPGNAGLKDQVLALKWVQKNISKFGGDPNNVTIFGQSAGGASVHLLTLSPMAKGLFHKAIAQSGCALNPWALTSGASKSLATYLNLERSDEKTIHSILMNKSVEESFEIQKNFGDVRNLSKGKFIIEFLLQECTPNFIRPVGSVVEKKSKDPFLSENPLDIMVSGKFTQVSLIIGYNSTESIAIEQFNYAYLTRPELFELSLPWYFGYKDNSVAKKIKTFYLGEADMSEEKKDIIYDIVTDTHFLHGMHFTILSLIKHSKAPIYVYRVSLETKLNIFKSLLKIKHPGVCHSDDLGYLFKNFVTPDITPESVEDIARRRFVKLWTNFATFGNPTPDKNNRLLKTVWKPVTNSDIDYLDIGEELELKVNPDSERIKFWKKLYAESPAGRNVAANVYK